MKFLVCFLSLLMLFSCNGKSPDIEKLSHEKARETTITIAILPEQNVFEQKKRYRPLAEYLSNALDVNVKIKLLDSYGSIYDEIKNRTIDGAFFGSFNYILTRARADIEPLARPAETTGRSNYRSLIFTRKDSGLTSDIMKWKGKKIALVHEVTTAGYIFPAWHLKKHGITAFEQYFGKVIFTGSHDAAILSVLKGQTDLGAAKDLIFEKVLSENPAMKTELIVLASSLEVPSNTLCVRSDLDNRIKTALKNILISMHTTPEGREVLAAFSASKFKGTADSEYDELRAMAGELDINLKTHPFTYKR
jgi:phosphonate transport system substrate-binding protein